jgi:hypothetical protein
MQAHLQAELEEEIGQPAMGDSFVDEVETFQAPAKS